jgi:hypothetical protein
VEDEGKSLVWVIPFAANFAPQLQEGRGYRRLSLETGSMDAHEPPRQLYARVGFMICGPFAEYTDDANSVFITKEP